MQTMLVHLRNPITLIRDLGWRNTAFMHFLLTANVISILFHPVFLLLAAIQMAMLVAGYSHSNIGLALLGLCTFNLVGGYTTYAFLALAVRKRCAFERPAAWLLLTLPFYWCLVSLAGWAAIRDLILRPFHWEKTEHGLANPGNHANI